MSVAATSVGFERPSLPAGWESPVSLAGDRRLEVLDALRPLLPDGGLRRGTTVTVQTGMAPGATLLALALLAGPSQAGSWAGIVGFAGIGVVAAAQAGIALDRLALVPNPGDQWPAVVAALVDSLDVILLHLSGRVAPGHARRLAARARERGAVLVTLGSGWPEAADVVLQVSAGSWAGLGEGHGHLKARTVEVTASGRRGAARPRRQLLWLPGPDGAVGSPPPVVSPVMPPVAALVR